MNVPANTKERSLTLATSATTVALTTLFVCLFVHIGVVALSFAGHPLAWSWLMQIAGIALGVALGMVLGAVFRRRA